MSSELPERLAALKTDYKATTGAPFSHFFCPILLRDENVDLSKAHLVNAAFGGSPRHWTIQRKDVDNFYGAFFESDFVQLNHSLVSADQVIHDRELHAKLSPKIVLRGEIIPHYVARGPVPANFTKVVVESPSGPTILGVKMTPQEFLAAGPETFEIHFHKDLRLASVASLLKCAHLTLFAMLGYRYALSRGGRFLGKTILGTFFDENLGLEKAQIQANGTSHFLQFANMVRPIVSFPNTLRETVADRSVHICMTDSETPWAMVVYLRTAEHWHAVLVPVMDTPEGSSTFIDFLNSGGSLIRAQHAQLHNDRWMLSGTDFELNWVAAGWP